MNSSPGLSDCWESSRVCTALSKVHRKWRLASAALQLEKKLSASYRHEDDPPAADSTLREPFSHTPVWPPPAPYEQPSALLLRLRPCLVGTQLPAARSHRYVSRGLLEGTPVTILIASSCKASGFLGLLFIFFLNS